MNGLAGRFLFGGGLGLALAFLLANYLSVALLSVYGDWLGWRQVTGAAPNALTSITQKITWALFFCSSWWMFWKFDAFFPLRPRETSDSNQSEEEESEFVEKEPSVEYFKPERDEGNSNSSRESEPEPEPEPKPTFTEEERTYGRILEIEEEDLEDFDAIKAIYRKRIAQYHPDKVLAMGPEIREIAEQKAKEINEAYEYFRAKSKRIEPQ